MPRLSVHRHRRILGHTRDYIARLGTRQEMQARLRDRDKPKVQERLDYTGRLHVDFLADNAALLTICPDTGARDLGTALAELVGAEKEEGSWPAMTLDVRLTVEVLESSPTVADLIDGG